MFPTIESSLKTMKERISEISLVGFMKAISFREKPSQHLQWKQDWLAVSSLSGFVLWFPKEKTELKHCEQTYTYWLVQASIQLSY